MAKVVKDNTTTQIPVIKASVVANPTPVPNKTINNNVTYMFEKQNYLIMIAGIVIITIGFMCMAGGRSDNPHVFDYNEMYSFRRITLAPILVILGFIVEIFAIMWMPKSEK